MYFTPKRLRLYLSALLVLELIICFGFRSSIRSGAIDFRGYYTAGYMLRTGRAHLLYDYPTEQYLQNTLVAPAPLTLLFFAPPFAALPFAPLSLLSYRSAFSVLLAVNLAMLLLAARIMRPHLRALTCRWRPTATLLFLAFLPAGLTLVMGQLSIALLVIACFAFILLEAERPLLAGLVFSLALIKLQVALPVALLFFLWRRWRFTLGFLLGAALLSALSAAIVGPGNLPSYLHSITHTSALAGTQLQSAVGIGPRRMANLYGLFFTLSPTNRLATVLSAAASIAVLAWAATRKPSLPLALLAGILVSYHLYLCDLTLLLLPISLLCDSLFAEEPAPQLTQISWLERSRRPILFCSLGVFLITPALIESIVNDLIFLLALPIFALALCPLDWSTAAPEVTPAPLHS